MPTTAIHVYRRSELEAIADGCLKRFHDIWIAGVDDSSDISLLGQAFHKVQHLYIGRLVAANTEADSQESDGAFVEGVAMAQLPARLIPELQRLWTFHVEHFFLPLDRYISSEERGGDTVSFAPDLLLGHPEENALEIVDLKSGWAPPPTDAELKMNFQARVYTRYARDRWPHWDHYRFTLWAVRFNKRVTVEFRPEELDAVDIEVQAAIATVELAKVSGQWPAIPGPPCANCTLACPVADNKLSLPKRLSIEQRQPAAEWALVAEKQLRTVKAALKDSVKTYGPISVNGAVWDNRPSVSRAYPIDAILEAFTALKIDRQAAEVFAAGGDLTISHSALEKVMRLYPELEPMLSGSAREKTSYRFSVKAPGAVDSEEAQ